MPFQVEHEIHHRRLGRNLGLLLLLVAFVALVFALTVVKVTRGDPGRGFNQAPITTAPAPEPTP